MFSESLPHLGGGKITDGIQFTFMNSDCFPHVLVYKSV